MNEQPDPKQPNPYQSPGETWNDGLNEVIVSNDVPIDWLRVIGIGIAGFVVGCVPLLLPTFMLGPWLFVAWGVIWWASVHLAARVIKQSSVNPATSLLTALVAYFLWVVTCSFGSAPFMVLHDNPQGAQTNNLAIISMSVVTFCAVFGSAALLIRSRLVHDRMTASEKNESEVSDFP